MPDYYFPSIFKSILGLLALVVLASALFGCSGIGAVPVPTPKHLEYANRNGQVTTLANLTMGRRLYIKRCSACHNLKRPSSLLPSEWPEMVERMSEDTELKPDQVKIITQYLVAVAEAAQDTTSAPPVK